MTIHTTPMVAAIRDHARAHPERTAVNCGTESLSWQQLFDGAQRMAAHLHAAGVREGDMMAISLPNGSAHIQATIAAWWLGAIPFPLSPKLPQSERTGILEVASPALVVGLAPAAAAGRPTVQTDVLMTEIEPVPMAREASSAWKAIGSGGSTGRPKVIVAAQPAEIERVAGFADLLRIPTDSSILVPGPLSHNAPFVMTMLGLMRGNTVTLMPRFDAEACLELAERHRATWIYQVPTMMLRIWRLPEETRTSRDLSSVQTVFHMAAACPPWLKLAWIEWLGGPTILELYAGAEMQAIAVVTGDEWLEHRGTVGSVHLGEMEIRDDDGTALPAGEIGGIWMRRGPGEPAPYRYLGAVARTDPNGWESLGDNGHFDSDGYLYLADRAVDMVVVGGSNVYPAELEAALDEHPAVRSSCVIGLPDDDLGNIPHAIVELAEDVSDEDLQAWMADRVAGYKVPRSYERADAPIRDDAGKVRRSQLRAERLALRENVSAAPAPAPVV